MKTILKIKFDNTFYLFLGFILLLGMFKEFTFIFFLLFFHELGHALTGIFLKWKVIGITFYPYGGLTLFEKNENSKINEEICILLAGPILQTITYLFLKFFFSYDYIRNYHFTILIFNLLPILTLDGGKLLNLLLNKFFNYLTSFYISVFVSLVVIISLFLLCIFNFRNLNLFLMSIFLFFKVIKSIKEIKYCYHKFLLERYLYNFPFSKKRPIQNIYSFYKECYHYIEFSEEKDYLKHYFSKTGNNLDKREKCKKCLTNKGK